ncbi:MAG TPA: POTRA domain-containing protein [Candidatus Limnocylindrales bacterium]|nr:POTRA domain-containing protein [Candidatus Limnocylindrales bacterium]
MYANMASRPALQRCLVSVCLLAFVPGAFAADDLAGPTTYEGKPIAAIKFEPAVQPVAETDLNRLIGLKPGTALSLDEVRDAIKRLYSSGQYSDIEADTQPSGAGLVLVFRTTDQWFVGPVETHGKIKLPPNRGQLTNASRLELGTPFSDEDVNTAVRGIKNLLQRNGLYLATVTPVIERDPAHEQVAITFQIDSGKRARYTMPVVAGDTKIDAQKLEKAAKYHGISRWKQVTAATTQNGVRNIRGKYQKQDRLTASVTLSKPEYLAAENRVREHIQADGGPKVKITTSGAKVRRSKLEEYVPVFDEETVNRDLLVNGARNLRDYFQNQGYFDVQVDFQEKAVNPDLEQITYDISRGERHKVVSLTVTGNHYFTTPEIRERMYIQPAGFLIMRHGRYSGGFATKDAETIQALYHDNGFHDCKVDIKTTDDYKGKKGNVAVTVAIQEGPQYKVAAVSIAGMSNFQQGDIEPELESIPGEPFSETAVAMDRDYIIRRYQSDGYPNAALAPHVTPGPGEYEMTVRYDVTEGQPMYVRDVLLAGLHITNQRLIKPNVLLQPGDPLSWTVMGDMQRRLYDLGVFDTVDMAIQNQQGDTESKYVDYHFVEGHRYNMAVGFGAEIAQIGGSQYSLNNPSGTTGFSPRISLQLSRLNMFGLGHSLTMKARYSTLDRLGSLSYLLPRFHNVDGRNISITALYDNTRNVLTFTAVRLQGQLQVSQKLSKATTLFWRYSWTHDQVLQSTLKINPLLIPLYSAPSHVGYSGFNIVQDRRDDPTDAHRGFYNSLDAGLAAHQFGGNRNFTRLLLRNSYYHPVATQFVLASNTEFGILHPYNTGGIAAQDYVPLPERFFGGGESSMRGFSENQAGPRDLVTGFPLGGNTLFFHSTELRFPFLSSNMQGVFFHDFGNIFSNMGAFSFRVHQKDITDFNYMVHAVGFGVRYKTPLGPIAVDLAYSLNSPTFQGLKGTAQQLLFGGAQTTIQNTGHFQFFFNIGQAF